MPEDWETCYHWEYVENGPYGKCSLDNEKCNCQKYECRRRPWGVIYDQEIPPTYMALRDYK